MKRTWLWLVFVFSLFPTICAFSAEETYTLDPQHTYVQWHVNHFGFSNPSGKWMAKGTLILDQDKPENNQVTASIDMADIITGIPELDKHLKGALFFDVKKFPTATFVSNSVDLIDKNKAIVHGTLTLHGVSKPITLNVSFNKIGENPISNKMSVGFSATSELNRSDFGINTMIPGIGDLVTLEIEAEAYR